MNVTQHDMKPLFGIDITSDKDNETLNGNEFIVRTTSEQTMQAFESKRNTFEEAVQKSEFPLWLQIIQYLCALLFLIVLGSSIKVGFETAMQNAPLLVIGGFLCGIVWGILYLLSKKKQKRVFNEENVEQQAEQLQRDCDIIYNDLGIPEDVENVDILAFRYKIKNGEIRPQLIGLQNTPYTNAEVKMYATDEDISLVDLGSVYSFKKEELKSIICVNKRIGVPEWNKEEDPRKGNFKPYKMTVNQGTVFFKPYYILHIEREGEHFGLYFPCYELEVFERLTGLTVEIEEA